MKILHTSDWHLDQQLYGQRRYEEHEVFLDWLRQFIATEKVNVLVVAGDIFDNRNPRLDTQELYVRFLTGLLRDRMDGKSDCRHVVIVAGNHDSAAMLEMNHSLLCHLNIHIVGKKPDDWKTAVLELKVGERTEAIVAAFPFISEVDVRKLTIIPPQKETDTDNSADTADTTNTSILQNPALTLGANSPKSQLSVLESYKENWKTLANLCVDCREKHGDGPYIPLISTGHLFTAGGKTFSEDGIRKIYVGTLEQFPGGEIPEPFDYVALGHLHVPQPVGKHEHRRYSGSPLPINFDEAVHQKQVVLVEWDPQGTRTIQTIDVPMIRKLVQIKGDWDTIKKNVTELLRSLTPSVSDGANGGLKSPALSNSVISNPALTNSALTNSALTLGAMCMWLEVQYTGTTRRDSLLKDLENLLQNRADVQLISCSSPNVRNEMGITARFQGESLKNLNPMDVFERVLEENHIDETARAEYIETYKEALELCDFSNSL